MISAASIGLGWWSGELAQTIQGTSEKIRVDSRHSRSKEKREEFARQERVAAAARAGKHVFVEKPFTLTQKSAEAAAGACKKANVVLAVGQNRRFSAVAQELRNMVEAGEFGTLLHIESNFSSPSAMKWSGDHWRASRAESPAGGLAGLGIHMIDLMTWLGGPARSVVGLAKRRALEIDIDDTTSALIDLASGTTAYLGTLCAAPFTIF